MPIYKGKSEDGSDMKLAEGVYVNPNNPDEWGNTPWPGQQKIVNRNEELLDYMSRRFSLNDVYKQIQDKICPLSRRLRDYVLSHFNDEGNFIVE